MNAFSAIGFTVTILCALLGAGSLLWFAYQGFTDAARRYKATEYGAELFGVDRLK